MLPYVDVEERNGVASNVGNQVLILGLAEVELAGLFVVDEPTPATAHDASCLVTEQFDELLHAAILTDKLCV